MHPRIKVQPEDVFDHQRNKWLPEKDPARNCGELRAKIDKASVDSIYVELDAEKNSGINLNELFELLKNKKVKSIKLPSFFYKDSAKKSVELIPPDKLSGLLKENTELLALTIKSPDRKKGSLNENHAREISSGLLTHKKLRFLDLSYNQLGYDGACFLLNILNSNQVLLGLELSCNQISLVPEKGKNILTKIEEIIENSRPLDLTDAPVVSQNDPAFSPVVVMRSNGVKNITEKNCESLKGKLKETQEEITLKIIINQHFFDSVPELRRNQCIDLVSTCQDLNREGNEEHKVKSNFKANNGKDSPVEKATKLNTPGKQFSIQELKTQFNELIARKTKCTNTLLLQQSFSAVYQELSSQTDELIEIQIKCDYAPYEEREELLAQKRARTSELYSRVHQSNSFLFQRNFNSLLILGKLIKEIRMLLTNLEAGEGSDKLEILDNKLKSLSTEVTGFEKKINENDHDVENEMIDKEEVQSLKTQKIPKLQDRVIALVVLIDHLSADDVQSETRKIINGFNSELERINLEQDTKKFHEDLQEFEKNLQFKEKELRNFFTKIPNLGSLIAKHKATKIQQQKSQQLLNAKVPIIRQRLESLKKHIEASKIAGDVVQKSHMDLIANLELEIAQIEKLNNLGEDLLKKKLNLLSEKISKLSLVLKPPAVTPETIILENSDDQILEEKVGKEEIEEEIGEETDEEFNGIFYEEEADEHDDINQAILNSLDDTTSNHEESQFTMEMPDEYQRIGYLKENEQTQTVREEYKNPSRWRDEESNNSGDVSTKAISGGLIVIGMLALCLGIASLVGTPLSIIGLVLVITGAASLIFGGSSVVYFNWLKRKETRIEPAIKEIDLNKVTTDNAAYKKFMHDGKKPKSKPKKPFTNAYQFETLHRTNSSVSFEDFDDINPEQPKKKSVSTNISEYLLRFFPCPAASKKPPHANYSVNDFEKGGRGSSAFDHLIIKKTP